MPENYKSNDDDVYTMNMHEVITLEDGTQIRRVPGGWKYTEFHWDPRPGTENFQVTSIFVPMT